MYGVIRTIPPPATHAEAAEMVSIHRAKRGRCKSGNTTSAATAISARVVQSHGSALLGARYQSRMPNAG
jgi:hypothetical protein